MSSIATASSATNRLSAWLRTLRLLPLLALSFLLAGCPADNVPLEIVGYNHTDHDIGFFSINDYGGPYIGKHEGGGKFTCCVLVPTQYKPGMAVSVRWGGLEMGQTKEQRVEVQPYGPNDFGHFAVHFLRDGSIKVFVTAYYLKHPQYPLKGDEAKL
ncbi:DUF3304 domain-containing protein [Dyella sp. M7H15-1]|uniref:DUF3304 domain-containing protein n=1 Tax=Dyella sp. M7H15-1 TaxID=2501295 RepID=UPI001004F507|nr:DUF3304 domain-containing protein [Dyella sp. M7H15-1]QAU23575.1 DUF3304 domain-containing protein [Dyella sp. M7H15-1]